MTSGVHSVGESALATVNTPLYTLFAAERSKFMPTFCLYSQDWFWTRPHQGSDENKIEINSETCFYCDGSVAMTGSKDGAETQRSSSSSPSSSSP